MIIPGRYLKCYSLWQSNMWEFIWVIYVKACRLQTWPLPIGQTFTHCHHYLSTTMIHSLYRPSEGARLSWLGTEICVHCADCVSHWFFVQNTELLQWRFDPGTSCSTVRCANYKANCNQWYDFNPVYTEEPVTLQNVRFLNFSWAISQLVTGTVTTSQLKLTEIPPPTLPLPCLKRSTTSLCHMTSTPSWWVFCSHLKTRLLSRSFLPRLFCACEVTRVVINGHWQTFPDLCLIYGWHVTTSWVKCPGQPSLPSVRGW